MPPRGIMDSIREMALYIRENATTWRRIELGLRNLSIENNADELPAISLEAVCLGNEQREIADGATEKDWEDMIMNGVNSNG